MMSNEEGHCPFREMPSCDSETFMYCRTLENELCDKHHKRYHRTHGDGDECPTVEELSKG